MKETKPFFVCVTVDRWKCLLEENNSNTPIPSILAYITCLKHKTLNLGRLFEILPCSRFMDDEAETWKRLRTFSKSHSSPMEKPESITEFLVPWFLPYTWDVKRGRYQCIRVWILGLQILTNDKLWFRTSQFSLLHLPHPFNNGFWAEWPI